MKSLQRNIDSGCDASGKNFETVLLSLRAFGNAGRAVGVMGPITTCLKSESNPLEIRVAAAEAFRRMPCDVEVCSLCSLCSYFLNYCTLFSILLCSYMETHILLFCHL